MRRWAIGSGTSAGVVVLILIVAQLVLPGIAAQRLRDRLSHSGRVIAVTVDAFPAIELLWHQADHVVIRMASYSSSSAKLVHDLGQLQDVGSLDASATELTAGLLTLRNASLRKRGSRLTGQATIRESDLRASLPVLDSVVPVTSAGGQLTLQGTATLFGVSATVDATVRPAAGALVISPDVPFGGLTRITLFSSPAVAVNGVSAAVAPSGFVARVTATTR